MTKYMAVTITICRESSLQGAFLYYSDSNTGLEISVNLSYEEGMKQLRQLEKLLNQVASITVNEFNPEISYKRLYGYIDRR